MRSYLLLTKLNMMNLLSGLRGGSLRKENGKLDISSIALYITAGVGVLVLVGMIVFMEVMLYRAVAGLHLENILIGLAILLSMVSTLLFGVFHTLGAMYFNRDTISMAYLPAPSRTFMLAKWTEIYLCEVLFSVGLLLPMLICHGIALGAGAAYYVVSLLLTLLTPLYPLAISLLLASVLGRISSLTKHKEVWVVIGTLVLLVIVLGSEWMLLPSIPEDADAMFFIRLLMDNRALLDFLIGAFPPVMWAVEAVGGNVLKLMLFGAVGIAAVAAVIFLMGGSYLRVCLKHSEHSGSKRRARSAGDVACEPRSAFRAILMREFNEVFKTPVYLMNAVMGVLMMPIMIAGMSVGISTSETGVSITEVLDQLLSKLSAFDLTLIMAALFSVMCLICPICSTAVSREGKRLPIMCMIPVAPRTILQAKLMVNVLIVAAGSVLMGAAAAILLGAGYLPHVAAAVALVNILSYAISIGNLTVDVLRPVLNWKNETEVMKQNMNSMFGALVSMVMIALVAAPPLLLLGSPAWTRILSASCVVLLELAAMLVLMKRVTEPRFAALEP